MDNRITLFNKRSFQNISDKNKREVAKRIGMEEFRLNRERVVFWEYRHIGTLYVLIGNPSDMISTHSRFNLDEWEPTP